MNKTSVEERAHKPPDKQESDMHKGRGDHACRTFGILRVLEPKHEQLALRRDIIGKKVAEHCIKGREAMSKSQFAAAVLWFSKAVHLQPKQAPLFVNMAEAYLQLCDFQSAAVYYRRVCFLQPNCQAYSSRLAFVYYMQGQCLWDQGMFFDALESFTRASELKPECRVYYMRSLACLSALGHHADCLRMLSAWLELDTPTADLLTLRARLHHQLRQMSLCYRDLKAALALGEECSEARSLLCQLEEVGERVRHDAVNRALAGELPEALVKINIALEHSPEDGQHYLFRGILHRRLKNFTAAIDDLALVLELSKATDDRLQREARDQLVLTYNDFAVHCFSREFYSEAAKLLNKAIEDQKDESGLYINRGDCFFKQGEWQFALADYQQAEELDPGNHVVWVRLAVIHNALGLHSYQHRKYQEAHDRFSVAIQYNPGVTLYHANRAKACLSLGDMEGAKHDAISALILDPKNDQVDPLLFSLFPGHSVSDVLASQSAKMVRRELNERLQACRLAHGLDNLLLMGSDDSQLLEDNDSASEKPKKAVTPCVPLKHVYREIVSIKQQADQAVKRTLQQRLSLQSHRPHLAPLAPVRPLEPNLGPEQQHYSWRKYGPFGLRF